MTNEENESSATTSNQPALQPPEPCPWCEAIPVKTDLAPSQRYRLTHKPTCYLYGRMTNMRGNSQYVFIGLNQVERWNSRARVVDGVVATVDAERQAAAIVTIWRAVKDHDDKLLVRYIKQALLEWCPVAATAPIAAPQDELVDEVQHRMDQVVEAAVEWHQAGREGGEWLGAADKLANAIDSLLELRSQKSTPTGLRSSPR